MMSQIKTVITLKNHLQSRAMATTVIRKQCSILGESYQITLVEVVLQLASNHSLGGNAFK